MNHTPVQHVAASKQRTLPPLPDWLADEARLADEAVLYGLSEARPDERIAQIRLAFAERTIFLEKQIEQAQEQVGDLNLTIEAAQVRLHDTETVLQSPPAVRWFSLAGQRLLLRSGLTVLGSVCLYFGTEALAPATGLSLLTSGLVGLSAVGTTLIRYHYDQKASLEQQRADRLHRDEQMTIVASELADYKASKQQLIYHLYQAEAERDQQYAHRDRLIRLFESEFDLARSLRYSLKPNENAYV